jgi:hypothetical protein
MSNYSRGHKPSMEKVVWRCGWLAVGKDHQQLLQILVLHGPSIFIELINKGVEVAPSCASSASLSCDQPNQLCPMNDGADWRRS